MIDLFTTHPIWDDKQLQALNSEPNTIISGCAGSGKTLLAIHLAKWLYRETESPILILVYTTALKVFIRQTLEKLNVIYNVDVMHDFEFQSLKRNRKIKTYSYIIIDEAQDFTLRDIKEFYHLAVIGVYVFGDDMQKLYETKKDSDEINLSLEEIHHHLEMPLIRLEKTHRISHLLADAISDMFPNSSFKTSSVEGKFKMRFEKGLSISEQLEWIKTYLLNNQKESVGILLRQNEPKRIGRDNFIPGIMDLFNYLFSEVNNIGFKYYNKNTGENLTERLDFENQYSRNIVTIHSSKGLQFDTVIIPFNDSITSLENDNEDKVQYVAMTRAKTKIIILYTKHLEPCFANCNDPSKYNGKIEARRKMNFTEFVEYSRRKKDESL